MKSITFNNKNKVDCKKVKQDWLSVITKTYNRNVCSKRDLRYCVKLC